MLITNLNNSFDIKLREPVKIHRYRNVTSGMKLKDLKSGQQFIFVTGTNKTKYKIVKEYPQLIYASINGYIEYGVTYNSRLNREVELLNMDELPIEISFIDEDGDKTIFSTETEADFVHVLVKSSGRQSAIAALKRHQVIELIHFLERHLEIK